MNSKKINKIITDAVKKVYSGDGLYGYASHLYWINTKKFYISIVYGRKTTDGVNNFHCETEDFLTNNKKVEDDIYFIMIENLLFKNVK